ncbi:hypothetical protein FHR81_000954 [Actinoalloteichus hoggarensis]|nr:hypothetical protein [Actinoalloteichus hoggarensis]
MREVGCSLPSATGVSRRMSAAAAVWAVVAAVFRAG